MMIPLAAWAVPFLTLAIAAPAEGTRACVPRTMRVSFYTCAEGFSHCLTKRGHQPIPFRTIAVGDRALLGRWLYIEDLGGWVHASDTGKSLRRDWIDVYIGEARMASAAMRLGIQHWTVRVCPKPPAVPIPSNDERGAPPASSGSAEAH